MNRKVTAMPVIDFANCNIGQVVDAYVHLSIHQISLLSAMLCYHKLVAVYLLFKMCC